MLAGLTYRMKMVRVHPPLPILFFYLSGCVGKGVKLSSFNWRYYEYHHQFGEWVVPNFARHLFTNNRHGRDKRHDVALYAGGARCVFY